MKVLSHEQELLTEYLIAVQMPLAKRMYIVGILWEEEATMEMLKYLVKTRETDQAKLYSTACEISERYKSETEE